MQSSRAIVIQQIKYSETSLIVSLFTEEDGLLSFIVKGVRGKKGKMRTAQFQWLNLLHVSYNRAQKSKLNHLIDVKISDPFTELLYHPVKRSSSLFIAELIYKAIKEQEENKTLFEFLHSSIKWLDLTRDSCTHYHIIFMMKLCKYLGIEPNKSHKEKALYFDLQHGVYGMASPYHSHYIQGPTLSAWKQLQDTDFNSITQLKLSNTLKRDVLAALTDYYKLHLVHFKDLNSHYILQQVFQDD